MRKGKDTFLNIAAVTVVITSVFGFVYGFWQMETQPAECQLASRINEAGSYPSSITPEMAAARNADTSNFDNMLKF